MILPNRDLVIENIKKAINDGKFDAKVEIGDPILTDEQKREILEKYLRNRKGLTYKWKNRTARNITAKQTEEQDRTTKIIGLDNIEKIKTGAIITSNHFGPLDSVPLRKLAIQQGMENVNIVAMEENLAMEGLFGYIMNYLDIIPISSLTSYMKKEFPSIIKEKLDAKEYILMYPEREMWFHYKKPRPCKPGAYRYAAKFNVPIISCFVELREQGEMETEDFYKTTYTLHILPTIYPDQNKSPKENSIEMAQKDYEQKKEAYERVYDEELTYEFKTEDIAGWREKVHESDKSKVKIG